jgi:group I intron endonuclease
MNYKIYGLKMNNQDIIKYVGLTKQSLNERFKEHLSITIKKDYKNGKWIKKYKDVIEIVLIEDNILCFEDACQREKYYISHFRELGFDLNNLTDGGEGVVASPETRLKISKSQKNKIIPYSVREKISNTLKGRKLSEETILKISASKKGKELSKETKFKMSESKKGITFTDEHKLNISLSKKNKTAHNKGVPCSKEQKEKLSKILKGKPNKKSKIIEAFLYSNDEFIGRYNSIKECFEKLNLKSNHISSVLSGKRKQSYGYYFKEIEKV